MESPCLRSVVRVKSETSPSRRNQFLSLFREVLAVGLPPSSIPEIFGKDKLLLARGAAGVATGPQLDILVSLAGDADEEVRRAAQNTLGRLSDEYCAKLLAAPSLPEPVVRYFLDPARLRPALLPILLGHPACPPEAIVDLAAEAG